MLIGYGGFGAAIVLAWIFFLVHALANIDLVALLTRGNPSPTWLSLALAVAVTVVAAPSSVIYVRRRLHLAQHGVEVSALVTRVGPVGYGPDRKFTTWPVRYRYEFQGQTYTGAVDIEEDRLAGKQEGDTILVLVDPDRPARSALMEDVLLQRKGSDAKPAAQRVA